MARFIEVSEGQPFAGSFLTSEGAAEVNGARNRVASERVEPLSIRIAKAKRGTKTKDPLIGYIDKALYESDQEIYPGLLPNLGK